MVFQEIISNYNMKFKIEDGIPLPDDGASQYPIEDLKKGQSFLVPAKGAKEEMKVRNIVNGRKRKYKGKRKFTTHKVKGGIRVWRIK